MIDEFIKFEEDFVILEILGDNDKRLLLLLFSFIIYFLFFEKLS
jgi:hypothetical protein